MKSIFLLMFILLVSAAHAQFDTTLDYKERFYREGKLLAENRWENNKKQGLWIEYLDKQYKPCNQGNHYYYRLIEYKDSVSLGKVYAFYRPGKFAGVCQYTDKAQKKRIGTDVWYSKKGIKTWMSYNANDTSINWHYYDSGKPWSYSAYYKNDGRTVGHLGKSYNRKGHVWYLDFYNTFWPTDTSYHLYAYGNGKPNSERIKSKKRDETIYRNRKGEITLNLLSYPPFTKTTWEKFRKGKPVKRVIIQSDLPKNPYPFYEMIHIYGEKNPSTLVIEKNWNKTCTINDKVVTEQEYDAWSKSEERFARARTQKHYLRYFDSDSVLVYEGLYRDTIPCGRYIEHYPNGKIKTWGHYNDKGEKTSLWAYYDEKGRMIKREWISAEAE